MLVINKNIMLQPLSQTHPIKTILTPTENVLSPSTYKGANNRHILNLSIDSNINKLSKHFQNKTTDTNFATFYNSTNISWRVSNAKRWQKGQRKVATSDRQSVVGTPFNSLQLAENQDGTAILPLMDREHYRYLVKAISGIKRGRQLSEINTKDAPQAKRPIPNNLKVSNRYTITHLTNQSNPQNNKCSPQNQHEPLYAPNIVTISPQLKSRKQNRFLSQSKDNSFQKIFKNKRRLQNKYFDDKVDDGSGFRVSILGEEELMIHQINWGKHRRIRNNH